MKTLKLNVIKKNRVYFKCTNEQGYEVKLKVTPKSENLSLGEQELLVNDISVRSKYGVDVIYELESEVKDQGVVTLKHRYNEWLVASCQNLGGRWDADAKVWVFPKIVEDAVEELDFKYNSNVRTVDLIATKNTYTGKDAVTFAGYPLARAFGRDSGAKVCEDVALLSGKVTSGGSMKNWSTEVREGAVFRLKVSQQLIDIVKDSDFEVKIIEYESIMNEEDIISFKKRARTSKFLARRVNKRYSIYHVRLEDQHTVWIKSRFEPKVGCIVEGYEMINHFPLKYMPKIKGRATYVEKYIKKSMKIFRIVREDCGDAWTYTQYSEDLYEETHEWLCEQKKAEFEEKVSEDKWVFASEHVTSEELRILIDNAHASGYEVQQGANNV
jgi:hypothetical protein